MKNTGTVLGVIFVVVLVLLLVGGAGVGLGGYGYGMMGHMMGGYGMMGRFGAQGFGFNPLGAILPLVFWALVVGGTVLVVVWLIRNAGRTGSSTGVSEPALELIKSRFAKGEITKEQFDEMRRTLAQ